MHQAICNMIFCMFDLLISNCDTLVYKDGNYAVEAGRDLAIAQGRIAAMEPMGVIGRDKAHEFIDAAGELSHTGPHQLPRACAYGAVSRAGRRCAD